MASLDEDIHINELGRGLSWNDFQKYYRGYQNGEVAKRWQAYNLLEGPGPANPRPPPVESTAQRATQRTSTMKGGKENCQMMARSEKVVTMRIVVAHA